LASSRAALTTVLALLAMAPPALARSGTVDLFSQADVRIDGAAEGDRAGGGMATAGDMNGDGRDDVIVGAREADNNGRADSGSAYIVFGRQLGGVFDLATFPTAFRIDGAAAGDNAGEAVAPAGDVNGDGIPDAIVAAPGADNNARALSGSAYVVFGKGTTTNVDLAALGGGGFRIDGAVAADTAGSSVAGLGDVNGDGLSDVAIGAELASNNARALSGSTWVVFGKASTTPVDLAALGAGGFRIDGAETEDQAAKVAGPGDVNGDGRPDILVGALGTSNNGRNDSGSAYLVFGKPSATSVDLATLGTQGSRIDGAVAEDHAGFTVAGPGDMNGGGRPDLVVGADRADNNGRNDSGSSFVVFGEGLGATLDLAGLGASGYRIDGAEAGGLSATSLSGAGDIDGDSRPDVVVGAPVVSNNGRNQSGSAYVSFGKASTTPVDLATLGSTGLRVDGAAGDDRIGDERGQVAAAGDFNGDGGDDLLVGTIRADRNGRTDSGSAYVVFGTPRQPIRVSRQLCRNVIRGTKVADRLIGTEVGDRILARRGNDLLRGRRGKDCLAGGLGRDRLFGGPHRDRFVGGPGSDFIASRDRRGETVRCGRGRDRVKADRFDRLVNCERPRR
jgi:FG-GAP repeat protein/hemolysin type calcium-binding protein